MSGRTTPKGTMHRSKHTTRAGITKAHPIGTKPARRKAAKQAKAARKRTR